MTDLENRVRAALHADEIGYDDLRQPTLRADVPTQRRWPAMLAAAAAVVAVAAGITVAVQTTGSHTSAAGPSVLPTTIQTQPAPVPATLVIPTAAKTGPAGVSTGFPHTPPGALAQLIAIDRAAIRSGSAAGVRAVGTRWSSPGASWSRFMATFESGEVGRLGPGAPPHSIVVTPLLGMIKSTAGASSVVPCVYFRAHVTITQRGDGAKIADEQTTLADCERMLWHSGRWVIGRSTEWASAATSVPDTQYAISHGYEDLRYAGSEPTVSAPFVGYKWTLVSVHDKQGDLVVPQASRASVAFAPDGEILGSDNVNAYGGRYSLMPNGYRVSDVGVGGVGGVGTDPLQAQITEAIEAAFGGTVTASVTGDTLTITHGDLTLTLQRASVQPDESTAASTGPVQLVPPCPPASTSTC